MERTRTPHRWLSLFAILALVFALAACGSAVVPGEIEDEAPIEDVNNDAPGGKQPAAPTTPDLVENTYEEPPTIDGEPVDQGVIDDMDDFDDKVFRGDFSDLDFSGKVLDKAILAGAKFDRSKFSGVRFNGVKAWHASFIGADFTNAHFAGADLSYGIFKDATFTGAAMPGGSFTTVGATFDGARWVNGVKICAEGSVGTCN